MSGQLHDVSLKIGELLAKVEGLENGQESNTRQMARIDSKVDSMGGDVRQLKNDMNELKPSVKRYDRDRNRILGGVAVISVILDGTDLVESLSLDSGETWSIAVRHSLAGFAFPSGQCFAHFLTGKRGRAQDDHIEMMCSVVDGTASQWAAGAIDMAPAKVLRMKLPVAGPASLLV